MFPIVGSPNIQEGDARYRIPALAIASDYGICSAVLELVPAINSADALHNVTKCGPGVVNAGK